MDSNNRTFILIKPDGLNDLSFCKRLYFELEKRNIKVVKTKEVYINNDEIIKIWPYCATDKVCETLMCRYLSGKKMKLLDLICEDNAIEKVKILKAELRLEYASSPFCNRIHTPSNIIELERDYKILTGEKLDKDYMNKTLVRTCKKFKKTSTDDFIKCAIFLEKLMSNIKFEYVAELSETLSNKYKIYILNDNIHDAKFVAGVLLDYFHYFTLERAYYIAFGVDYLGKFLVFTSNDLEDYYRFKNYMHQFNINISLKIDK